MYTEDDLRRWAEAHEPVGMAQAPVILRLLKEVEWLREIVQPFILALAERVCKQSELLSRKAEAK